MIRICQIEVYLVVQEPQVKGGLKDSCEVSGEGSGEVSGEVTVKFFKMYF